MVDETGKNIGITELEAEENRENNSMSFDEIDFGVQPKIDNSKLEVNKVEEPSESEVEEESDEFDDEDEDYEPTDEEIENDFYDEEGEVEE